MKLHKKRISIVCCILLLTTLLASCASSGGYEKKLIGPWYQVNDNKPWIEFYSNGTCEMKYEYGTCQWEVIEGNVLKITNYYGEIKKEKIVDLSDDTLTLENRVLYDSIKIDLSALQ